MGMTKAEMNSPVRFARQLRKQLRAKSFKEGNSANFHGHTIDFQLGNVERMTLKDLKAKMRLAAFRAQVKPVAGSYGIPAGEDGTPLFVVRHDRFNWGARVTLHGTSKKAVVRATFVM